ncbi:hypothetical protein B0H13DRAFT_1476106, partial [Mycena leptocephala]
MQIGSPMASLYLLGNPDNYTTFSFNVFWWKSYVKEVKKDWNDAQDMPGAPQEVSAETVDPDREDGDETAMMKSGEEVGATNVDDYVFRSSVFNDTSL